MKTPTFVTAIVLACVAGAGHLSAQTALKDEPQITDGLIVAGMAYEISERCDSIDVRLFRGLSYLQSLKSNARDLGYSSREIEAYVDDRDEQDRLEEIARERLATLGATHGDEASFCRVGQAQIDADTRVGWLLR